MENIQYCPFCGGNAKLCSTYGNRQRLYFVFVKCDVCGAQGKTYASRTKPADDDWNTQPCEDAVKAWNMRSARACD